MSLLSDHVYRFERRSCGLIVSFVQRLRAMTNCAAESLKIAATNERHVSAAETGFFGVPHTWERDVTFHPHAHFVVPDGGLDQQVRWRSSCVSVFVPAQIIAVLYRNKLRDRLRGTGYASPKFRFRFGSGHGRSIQRPWATTSLPELTSRCGGWHGGRA